MKTFRLLFAAAAALFAVACSNNSNSTDASADADAHDHPEGDADEVTVSRAQLSIVDIQFDSIRERPVATEVKCTGELDVNPSDRAEVTPYYPGKVLRILVKEGQAVRAGQTVALIENPEAITLQQNYLTAADRLRLASDELRRQEALAKEGAGVARNLEQARADYRIATTELAGCKAQLTRCGINPASVTAPDPSMAMTVRSPITGTVSAIASVTGSYAQPGEPMMTLVNNRGIFATARLYEKELPLVAPGQKAEIVLLNNPATRISGTVESVNASIDPATKTINARIVPTETPDGVQLLPGMGVTAYIMTGTRREPTVPSDAVIMQGGKSYIFIVSHEDEEDMTLRKIEVTTGMSTGGYTAVYLPDGISPKVKIVTEGTFYVQSMAADHGEHSH